MEHLLVKVPSEQIEMVTRFLKELNLEVENIQNDNLTNEQHEKILKVQASIREGKFLTTKEMEEKFEQWRTK